MLAIAGVLLTVYQAWRTQLYQRRSVRPLLQLRSGLPQGGNAELQLSNIGLGPAVLVSSRTFLDNELIGDIARDSVNRLRDRLDIRPSAATFVSGEAIGKDATVALLSLPNYDRVKNSEFADLITSRLRLEIVYESLYGGENFRVEWPKSDETRIAAHR